MTCGRGPSGCTFPEPCEFLEWSLGKEATQSGRLEGFIMQNAFFLLVLLRRRKQIYTETLRGWLARVEPIHCRNDPRKAGRMREMLCAHLVKISLRNKYFYGTP